jgi:hypothetical protein
VDQVSDGIDPRRRIAGIVVTETDDDAKERRNSANVPARAMGSRHEDAFMDQNAAAIGSYDTGIRKYVHADILECVVYVEQAGVGGKSLSGSPKRQERDERNDQREIPDRKGLRWSRRGKLVVP